MAEASRARMTGQAQIAYKQLSEGARAGYAACIKSLRERFEPACKKHLYVAECETRCKKKSENWAAFAEDPNTLIAKAAGWRTLRSLSVFKPLPRQMISAIHKIWDRFLSEKGVI